VTGATGLVGSHVVERLLSDGWRVRALVRSPNEASRRAAPVAWDGAGWLRSRGVELRSGDILDLPSLAAAAGGCDVIFHTAAAVTPSPSRVHPYDAFRVPNVDGTRNAIAAAERAGARLVQLSSAAVYGPEARYADSAKAGTLDEDTALQPLPEGAYYARSKREAEALVFAAHAGGKLWATAVRPVVIYGERDRQFVPRIGRFLRYGIALVVNGGQTTLAIVHAAGVADGAVRAALNDRAGGRAYNLTNDFDVTLRDFYRLAAQGLGRTARIVSVPSSLASAAFATAKVVLRLIGGSGMSIVTTSSVGFITRNNPFTSDRARRELGWSPNVRPDVGIPEAFRWWRAHSAGSR